MRLSPIRLSKQQLPTSAARPLWLCLPSVEKIIADETNTRGKVIWAANLQAD
jgi:hypothetical protein